MDFTTNLTVLVLIGFFSLYAIIYRYFKDNIAVLNAYVAAGSLSIYAFWYPPAVLILLVYALLVRYAGAILSGNKSKALVRSLVIFLVLVLAFFKYYKFFVFFATKNPASVTNLFVPLGISFFTCSVIGYFIDIYHGKADPPDSFVEALLLISFWPSLSSGPILRSGNFFANLKKREPLTRNTIAVSMVLVASGIIKKLLIADNLGSYVNWNLTFGVERMYFHEAWITIMGFIGQIYGDFSGYSDMAIGFALLLGFKLPANFNYPFVASSLGELWRRWHISLSYWLRDYVYVPLGGGRKGASRKFINIIITFIVSGLWHGTGLGYIIWGLINGFYMAMENALGEKYLRINYILRRIITFLVFTTAGVFFRLDANVAVKMIKRMFFIDSFYLKMSAVQYTLPIIMLLGLMVVDHWIKFYRVDENGFPSVNTRPHALVILCVLLVLALLLPGQGQPFLYFQF